MPSIALPMIASQSCPNSTSSGHSVPNLVETNRGPAFSSSSKSDKSFTTAILMISAIPCRTQPGFRVLKKVRSVRVRTGGWYAPYKFLYPNPSQQVRGDGFGYKNLYPNPSQQVRGD